MQPQLTQKRRRSASQTQNSTTSFLRNPAAFYLQCFAHRLLTTLSCILHPASCPLPSPRRQQSPPSTAGPLWLSSAGMKATECRTEPQWPPALRSQREAKWTNDWLPQRGRIEKIGLKSYKVDFKSSYYISFCKQTILNWAEVISYILLAPLLHSFTSYSFINDLIFY